MNLNFKRSEIKFPHTCIDWLVIFVCCNQITRNIKGTDLGNYMHVCSCSFLLDFLHIYRRANEIQTHTTIPYEGIWFPVKVSHFMPVNAFNFTLICCCFSVIVFCYHYYCCSCCCCCYLLPVYVLLLLTTQYIPTSVTRMIPTTLFRHCRLQFDVYSCCYLPMLLMFSLLVLLVLAFAHWITSPFCSHMSCIVNVFV